MIVVTGSAGFISSCLVSKLNEEGITDLVLVDDFSNQEKERNYFNKQYKSLIHRDNISDFLEKNKSEIEFIFHLGARTDTTEFNKIIFDKLNLNYSKIIWNFCTENNIPLVYASSAATYGMGELGYDDNHEVIPNLKPLNPYGESKNDFDKWVLEQNETPPFWAGLKFFNVYGPNEYHKGRMASVVFHAFNQINKTGEMKLFESHHPDYKNGEQKRDFVYVKDVTEVCWFLYSNQKHSGIYNLGSGKARTFLDLAKGVFKAMKKEENISFIPTPIDIRDKYQYFTEANMNKLKAIGYNKEFTKLEDGINDYVNNYLSLNKIY